MSRDVFPCAAVVACGALLAGAFAARTPPLQAPDEQAHTSYVRELIIGRPVVIEPSDWKQDELQRFIADLGRWGWSGCPWDGDGEPPKCFASLSYEDHQPPLYYGVVKLNTLGRIGILPALTALPFLPRHSTEGCHGCLAAGFDELPWLLTLRSVSLWLSLATLVLTLIATRVTFARTRWLPLAATAFIAFLPMFAYMSAVVNNDALANLVMSLALLAAVRRLAGRTTRRRYVVFSGLIWALALLTKLTVYPVILPLAAAEWLRTRREGGRMRDVAAPVARSIALGLLVAAPWFIRNMRVYGLTDPFGLAAHDRVVVGQPRTADWIAQHGWGGYLERAVVFTFDSFWGVFGWMSAFMDRRIYIVLALASAVMAIGFAGYVRRAWLAARGGGDVNWAADADSATSDVGPLQRDVLVVFGLVVATTVGGYVWYNLTFVQHQGRYLFPALIPIACAAMLGIREWARWLARAVRRPAWSEPLALAGMAAFDGGLLATSVWALIHVIPTLWPGR